VTSTEYEQLVAEIANGIIKSSPDLQNLEVGSGRKNKIKGTSGYSHQIDVSLHEQGCLYLIECKRWTRSIGVAEVLVLAGRSNDIATQASSGSIVPIMVSMRKASSGAQKLAKHFGIALEIATSASEFGLRIGWHIHQAMYEGLSISEHSDVEVTRNGIIINE
jgi:hypothetical protein